MKYNLLFLDTNESALEMLEEYSQAFNATFYHFTTIQDMVKILFESSIPSVVIIDIDENEVEKFMFSSRIKNRPRTHIYFSSSSTNPDDRVRWLTFGAIGYITKPFKVEEVLHRSHAIVSLETDMYVSDSNFQIDYRKRQVSFKGKDLKVTPKLFDLIAYFISNDGKVITREEIMRDVFEIKNYLTDRNIDTMIKQIRKLTTFDTIVTIRGKGYKYKSD